MKTRLYLGAALLVLIPTPATAQILYTENFSVVLDEEKNFKGNVMPAFRFRNLKENLIDFSHTGDIMFRFEDNALTLANRIELTKFGSKTFDSGGYVYVEYMRTSSVSPFGIE